MPTSIVSFSIWLEQQQQSQTLTDWSVFERFECSFVNWRRKVRRQIQSQKSTDSSASTSPSSWSTSWSFGLAVMEASAQDEYVSDFDLEHLEEVVKREMLEQKLRAEAYAHHYQNLQPPTQPQSQQQQQQQPSSQPPSVAPSQVHVVSQHSSSASVAAVQQPTVTLKHQLQVGRLIDNRKFWFLRINNKCQMLVSFKLDDRQRSRRVEDIEIINCR